MTERYRDGLARFMTKLCRKYGVRDWGMRGEEDETVATESEPMQLEMGLGGNV
jgi:hypothetical protein